MEHNEYNEQNVQNVQNEQTEQDKEQEKDKIEQSGSNVRFYLPTLMRMGELHVRLVAVEAGSMTGEGYLQRVHDVVEQIPMMINALTQHELKEIHVISKTFKEIGALDLSQKLGKVAASGLTDDVVSELIASLTEFHKKITGIQDPPKSLLGTEEGVHNPDYAKLLKNKLPLVLTALDKFERERKLRVLAVDDALIVLRNVQSILSDQYTVYAMTKPTMVTTLLAHVVPELFLLDYKMPDISGFELLSMIRSLPEHSDTPIIFLTGMRDEHSFTDAVKLGACDYIVKPFKVETITEKVAKHIVRKKTF
jgi:response regulator RpfG family c-di-GMP phosphodiesterase